MPGAVTHVATGSIAAADLLTRTVGGAAGAQLAVQAHLAFVHAMGVGLRVAAAVALASAIAAIFALPRHQALPPAAAAEREPSAERDETQSALLAGTR